MLNSSIRSRIKQAALPIKIGEVPLCPKYYSRPHTRTKARLEGKKRFYTGVCKNGHDAERYVSTGMCVVCSNDKKRIVVEKEKEKYAKVNKNSWLKKAYGINLDQFLDLLKSQNNACAICFIELLPKGSNTHVDHCHTTNKIRGILCGNCNKGLGLLNSLEKLKFAIRYLENA